MLILCSVSCLESWLLLLAIIPQLKFICVANFNEFPVDKECSFEITRKRNVLSRLVDDLLVFLLAQFWL